MAARGCIQTGSGRCTQGERSGSVRHHPRRPCWWQQRRPWRPRWRTGRPRCGGGRRRWWPTRSDGRRRNTGQHRRPAGGQPPPPHPHGGELRAPDGYGGGVIGLPPALHCNFQFHRSGRERVDGRGDGGGNNCSRFCGCHPPGLPLSRRATGGEHNRCAEGPREEDDQRSKQQQRT